MKIQKEDIVADIADEIAANLIHKDAAAAGEVLIGAIHRLAADKLKAMIAAKKAYNVADKELAVFVNSFPQAETFVKEQHQKLMAEEESKPLANANRAYNSDR